MAFSVDVPATIQETMKLLPRAFWVKFLSTPESTLIIRGWRLYIIEISIRRKISLCLILWILYKKAKEKKYAGVLCLLRYLNNELVDKVKLVAIWVFLGMNASKTHVVQDSKEIKEE